MEAREQGMDLRDQAVLSRTSHDTGLLELELTRRRIPFVKYGGLRYLEAAHVKDLIALLRLADNPADEISWFRVLQLLDGVGPATARRVLDQLVAAGHSGWINSWPTARAQLPAAARETPARGPRGGPRHFGGGLVPAPPQSSADLAGPPHLDEDYLVLSTIHSAKGLEWHAVHVLALYDGNFPACMAAGSSETIDEERRLLYVAMTRARRQLHLYVPVRYYHRPHGLDDAHGYGKPSRFLTDDVQRCCNIIRPSDPVA